jgi:hypothetical protein
VSYKAGDRSRKLAAAGVLVHEYQHVPGVYRRNGVAARGARWDQGAEFATWGKYVTCPECSAKIVARRAKAKARLAAITGGP